MPIANTESRYGVISIFLHWLMAIIVIGLLALGLYMVSLPISLQKLKFFGWHKEFGILVLMLVCARLGWRFANVQPQLPSHMRTLERVGAHGAHLALYGCMFAMPLTGWMLSSAADLPVSFFGLFVLPDLVSPDNHLRDLLITIHGWLGYGLIALIVMHASAALHHHFYYKDDILRRILP